MCLTFTGAEIAWGGEILPPPQGRVILRPSPGSVLKLPPPIVFGTLKYARIWVDLRRCPIGGWVQVAPLAPPPLRGDANVHFSGSANGFVISVLYFTHSQSILLLIFLNLANN